MTSRIPISLGLIIVFSLTATASRAHDSGAPVSEAPQKRATTASRLLLPFFEVDLSNQLGATTFFSVRNETTQSVDVRVSLFAPDSPQSPFFMETATLTNKKLMSVNVRSKLSGEGMARGYGIIETVGGESVIQGDYFQVTPDEGFATGNRLVNIDPGSQHNDLCSVFTIRLLDGGPFDGTTFTIWLDLDVAPQGTDVLSYSVYKESGGQAELFADLPANEVVLRTTAAELTDLPGVGSVRAGAIEFQLNDGVQGHISAVMSALGLYSVGLEAACRD